MNTSNKTSTKNKRKISNEEINDLIDVSIKQLSIEMKQHPLKTKQLFEYMLLRSKIEKSKWKLSNKYLENLFSSGIRVFFGVHLDDFGNILYDEQEPVEGHLQLLKQVGWF